METVQQQRERETPSKSAKRSLIVHVHEDHPRDRTGLIILEEIITEQENVKIPMAVTLAFGKENGCNWLQSADNEMYNRVRALVEREEITVALRKSQSATSRKELEQEYNKLIDKADKLKIEKDDILGMMTKIEADKKEVFMKTYSIIASNFTRIFNSLTTKGEAYLDIENKENPFEAGVEIKVRITGNKFLDIKSLSGGEKTLAALSFIFAIQEHQPAPFYLLDEVDAALDKANSEKLSKLIRQYSNNAQYIVISHNDNIITEAQQIYGVSMQQGISKVVSLKI